MHPTFTFDVFSKHILYEDETFFLLFIPTYTLFERDLLHFTSFGAPTKKHIIKNKHGKIYYIEKTPEIRQMTRALPLHAKL